nr:MAG TPA: hypothetical protein [Herelleviridae sp.]
MGNEFKLKYHENNFVRRKRSPWKKSCRTGSLNIPALSESQVKRIMDIVDENPKN